MIEIYTDGSCKGNPGPGGWAAIFLHEPHEENSSSKKTLEKKFLLHKKVPKKILSGHEANTTNNRMEMTAIIEALKFLHKNYSNEKNITLYSDSNLIIQTLNQGWKKKANLDLWKEMDTILEKIHATHEEQQRSQPLKLHFVWVRGHADNHWNNECDKKAVEEAKNAMKKQ